MRNVVIMEYLFVCTRRKKIIKFLLLIILIFVFGYSIPININLINYINKKPSNENASLFKFDVGYKLTGLLFAGNKINTNEIPLITNNNNNKILNTSKSNNNEEFSINNNKYYNKNKRKSENDIKTAATYDLENKFELINKNNTATDIRSDKSESLKAEEERRSIKDSFNREEIFSRRKLRIAEQCLKFNINQNDISGGSWGQRDCHPTISANGYKECINSTHFPLDRSSSSMTCLINKVASTSVATLFLENNGHVIPSQNGFSPHKNVTSITATREEEFLFAKNHFFKFLIVRDPFERLLSAYVDKVVIADHYSLLGLRADILKFIVENKGYLSNKFVKYDSNLVKKNGVETYRVTNESQDSYVPSFGEFLEYILDTNLEGDEFESHWVPYWKWCAPCSMIYDFIAKLDSSPSGLEFIWNRMGIHDKKRVPWLNKSFNKRQELEESKANHYSLLSLTTIAEIYKKFLPDFKLFDYDIRDVLLKGNHCTTNVNCESIMQKYFYR